MTRNTGDALNDLRRRERETWLALVDAFEALTSISMRDGRAIVAAQGQVVIAKEKWRIAYLSVPSAVPVLRVAA